MTVSTVEAGTGKLWGFTEGASRAQGLSFPNGIPMYAIISDGGRQYKVEEGLELDLDYREGASAGDTIVFDEVLAWSADGDIRIGTPKLAGATVTGEVLAVTQGPKLVVQKIRRRKTTRRKNGHRQLHTRVKIGKLSLA